MLNTFFNYLRYDSKEQNTPLGTRKGLTFFSMNLFKSYDDRDRK